ncbi:MAG TPA: DNA replication/repair protein RecF [Sphingomicrobium sp.]|nr:DNA replication/repair protein RecF [Sphingomicrobium sp.]
MSAVSRLTLTDFRSYASAEIAAGPGFVLLFGENGAGKTNILEAVSLLTPGRGLRGAALSEMARKDGEGSWAVAANLGGTDLGTGTQAAAPERRQVRVNGAPAAVNSLSEWLSVLWLTPAMDRLFTGSMGERRRFLDRLVLALEPSHAHHSTRYDAAMRARNKLLADGSWDAAWLDSLEAAMAEHGAAIADARGRSVEALEARLADVPDDDFASAAIALQGWDRGDMGAALRNNRVRDAAVGRATEGPHRQDLIVLHRTKQMAAAHSSTGEQKALLLGLVLAHADLVAERRGAPPILLLDEVAAHLDPGRRSALFARLDGRGQVWMTATESALFDGIGAGTRLRIEPGIAHPE